MNYFQIINILIIFIFLVFIAFLLRKHENKKIIIIPIILFLISIIINLIGFNNQTVQPQEKEVVLTKQETKLTYKQIELNEPQEKNKKGALISLVSLLKSYNTFEGMTVDERFNQLSADDTKFKNLINEDSLARLHLKDFMLDDKGYSISSLSILGFIKLLNEKGNTNLEPVVLDESLIYLDDNNGVAHIPSDIFLGKQTAMSFEMIYVDNQWKLSPYTFIQSIQLSNQIKNNN